MNELDCYFFVDMDMEVENEDDRAIRCLCLECRNEHYPDVGWFYQGSEQGYGPWNYLCRNCGKEIHTHEEEHDE